MRVLCTTTHRFEDIAAKEIESFGGKVIDILKGKIIADGFNEEDIVSMNFSSRTIHRICILLAHQKFSDIEEIYRIAKNLDYTQWLSPDKTFEVRTNREGEHDFTSMDVNRYVGQAVIESYMEDTGHRLKVNLEEPDVSIKCWVQNDYFLIGIDTTGDSLHQRDYRVYQHHAPLRSTIAAAMIMWSGWKKNKMLCDPFCGSGTILIEAAHFAKKFPPNIRRNEFLYKNLKVFQNVDVEEVREKLLKKVKETKAKIYGVDVSPKHIEGCRKCIIAADVGNLVRCRVDNALNAWEVETADYIITNPPYGIRSSSLKKTIQLYRNFAERLLNMEDKIFVVITPHRTFEYYFENFEKKFVKYGDLDVFAYKIKI